ncbi:transcriptional-regulating factor 1 isoform X4 [Anguilla anguilla]|nr:transcriptional-regulating factor 1 isoform X4 [Anguilla anguilla]XP_035285552.1 transcriptional-regulating factor 1 isoform X4 [Anguilla anguilla]XP_035285559.1 transcriptional-regulating factor 1 isoform X4 [Anguilla anguilla]XP_035285569.1 transcriptional-regulating factor 1 isoform X4 [Anguilla anguilla]
MTEQPFYPAPPTMGYLDGNYFPQHDPTALCHSYLSTGGSTELHQSSPPFYPSFSAPESPYATGVAPPPPGSPLLRLAGKSAAPVWDSQPAGGTLAQSKSSPREGYQLSALPQGSSALQRLDSFSSAFASHNLCMFRSSAPSLDMPLPFCLTTPSDVFLQQLLTHRPQQTEIQPMGAQQTCPELESEQMSSCDQRHTLSAQDAVQLPHGYLLQEQYCPLQQHQEMNYLLYSGPTANPATQTSNPSHSTANPATQTSNPSHSTAISIPQNSNASHPTVNSIPQTTNPTQTHNNSAHPFANPAHQNTHSTQLSPPFSSSYSQVCNFQLYSQPDPTPSIPRTHFYYQNHHQNQNQNHHLNQNQNHQQTPQPSSFQAQQQVQMLKESEPLSCEQSCSDSRCPTLLCPALLSPAHLSPVDPNPSFCQPHPLLAAATHSPRHQNLRSEMDFHGAAQPQCCSPSAPQWRQVFSSVPEQELYQDHSVLVKLMETDVPRLLCSLCQKEFKSLPALNGHMRSHGGGVPPKTPLKMGCGSGAGPEKRSRSRSVPLISASSNGAVLFQSLLRSPALLGQAPPYTPPPMLCPTRHGSGLFNNICPGAPPPGTSPTLSPPRVLLTRTSSLDSSVKREIMSSEEKLVQIKPQINIGLQFQAVIPELQRVSHIDRDSQKAQLLWSPQGVQEIPTKQRVDALLNMACSSILPGGGTNTEFALHCLFECRGDLLATLDRLLMQKPVRHKSNPLAYYHYAGSDNWTLVEKKQLNRAFILHNKDFFLIQKMVKTKTVSQCVEYYYTWKKRLRLGKREGYAQVRPASLGPITGVHTPKCRDVQEEELISVELDGIKQEVSAYWSTGLENPVANEIGDFSCDILASASTSSSQKALNSRAQIRSRTVSAPTPPAERILSSPPLQPALDPAPLPTIGSALRSPSPGSADAGPAHIFPCKECGKVFFKIKSRNAHMKTHRQQDDPQDWLHLRPLSHPATPAPVPPPTNHPATPAPVPPPTNHPATPAPVPPPTNHPATPAPVPPPTNLLALKEPFCIQREEEEEEEEEDPFLPVHALLQMETGQFNKEEL